MRFSNAPLIAQFFSKYDRLNERDRQALPIEAVALACKINVSHLWGEIMLAMRERSVNAVKVIAIAAHPSVMKSRVEFAKLPGGYRDRDALDVMMGALPKPKGISIFNKIVTGTDAEEKDEPPESVDDLDYMFPDSEVMQEKVTPMRQKLLEGE